MSQGEHSVLQALSREQRSRYLTSLTMSPQKRVDARHRYLMLREMPYRDSRGRPTPKLTLNSLTTREHFLPYHTRRASKHLAGIARSSSTLGGRGFGGIGALTEREVRQSRLRQKRTSQVEFLIKRCEESVHSTGRKSQSPKKDTFSPVKRISKRIGSVPVLF